MLTIICVIAILGQVSARKTILDEAVTKIERATTLSMTIVETTEEFPRPRRTECAFRKGGYLRIDNGRAVQIENPKAAWMLSVKEKTYASLPILPMDSTAIQAMNWLDVTFGNLPILNVPTETVWHGKKALRLELDGRKKMTKETKLFVFLQPDTLAIGPGGWLYVTANQLQRQKNYRVKDMRVKPYRLVRAKVGAIAQ